MMQHPFEENWFFSLEANVVEMVIEKKILNKSWMREKERERERERERELKSTLQ